MARGHCPLCGHSPYDDYCEKCGYEEVIDVEQETTTLTGVAVPLVSGGGAGPHEGVEGDGRGVLPEVRVAGVSDDHECFRGECSYCRPMISNPAEYPVGVPAPTPEVPGDDATG